MSVLQNGYKADLEKRNIKKRVGIIGDNSVQYVEALLKIWNEDSTAVLIDWRIPINVVLKLLKEADVSECYIDEGLFSNLYGTDNSEIKFIVIKSESKTVSLLPINVYTDYKINNSSDEAIIFYSSGTTGKAKGIVLSHKAINYNSNAVMSYMKPSKKDTIFIAKTLAHSSTLVCELLVALKSRSQVVITPTVVSPRFSLENIIRYNTTIVCVNPTLLNLYVRASQDKNYDFSCLRLLYTSGAIADTDLLKEAQAIFRHSKVMNVYGLTEAGPRATAQRYEDGNIILGSVGKEIDGVKVKIVDYDGKELPALCKGIIHVDTPSRMSFYISGINPKKSLYKDWINTGDIGYIDQQNNLYIVGRYDNMITQGSHNVYTEDIEAVIKKSHLINECLVFGVKNSLYGEKIICYYQLSENSNNKENYISEIRKHCLSNLATYEIPNEFYVVKDFPMTSNGKVSREAAREHYNNTYL